MESCVCHIGLSLLVLYFVASTASRSDVSSPNNVTFGLKGMFNLFWEWKPFSSDCSIRYVKEMKSSRNGYKKWDIGSLPSWEYEILRPDQFDLNDNLSLFVEAKCNNMPIDSLKRTVQLAPGDERTAVKNLSCVWHYPEHVKCTWQPGPNTPPNVNYRIFYWIKDNYSTSEATKLYTLAEFWDLLETGRTCELYLSNDLETIGCRFILNKSSSDLPHFAMVVTDASKSIKPYIHYENALHIAKLIPPKIIDAYMTANNTIYVSWNKSQDIENIEYELLLTSSSSKQNELYMSHDRRSVPLYKTGTGDYHCRSLHTAPLTQYYGEARGMNHKTSVMKVDGNIPISKISASSKSLHVLPHDTYTVKVRVKLSRYWLSAEHSFIWSDWSNEKILKGNDDERLISIIIPLGISAVVIVAAVFLLLHMEKLKVLICPQIPDPARIFPKDLQQWLKNDVHIVYNKPEKEEICPVYMM